MQSIPHSMAHRGAGVTRTNTRWHPYTPPRAPGAGVSTPTYSLLTSSSSVALLHQHPNSQESSYLITPAASVYTISPAASTFSQSPHPLASSSQQTATQQTVKQLHIPTKTHPAKATYVASLVDQAVKSLTDIWRPESIPLVFASQTDITVLGSKPPHPPSQRQTLKRQTSQLPSPPCSPTALRSPLPSLPTEQPHASTSSAVYPSAFLAEHFGQNAATVVSEKDLVPMKTFVQEVLRRSRTTCSVLQSALCYIEAVRKTVPDLVEKEKMGTGVRGEPELDERIMKEDEASSSSNIINSMDTSYLGGPPTELMSMDPFDGSCVPTVLQMDATLPTNQHTQAQVANDKRRKIPAKPLTPLPPLPSPLLCPRRTFLAALILASKFLQDRCYSNRAWAKLSGLPPREVGRCERALGDALGWRLWVGKSGSSPSKEENSRAVQRTKSESALAFGASSMPPALSVSHFPSPPMSDAGASPECGRAQMKMVGAANRALRRHATMPEDTATRSVPPRYRSPGSLPFSFAGPPLAVIAAHQHATLSAQQTLLSSCMASQTPMSSDPTPVPPILLEEPTPRFSYSPLSLGDPSLETPLAASSSYNFGYGFSNGINGVWSPAQSTGSNDSSDSSSVGSEAVATPPDLPASARTHAEMVSAQCDALSQAQAKSQGSAPPVSDPIAWYAQVLQAGALGNGDMSVGTGGIGNMIGNEGQAAISMLDSLGAGELGFGFELGFGVSS